MSGPAPPPPPPPPAPGPPPPAGHSTPRGPTPQTPMKRLQWVKIPEVKVKNSENLWTNAGKMFPGLSVNFDRIEQLFSCRSLGVNHHGYPFGDRGLGDPNHRSAFNSPRDGIGDQGQYNHHHHPHHHLHPHHHQRHSCDLSSDCTDGFSNNSEKKRKQEEVNLLDPKRSMNVNIFIRQLRLSNLELVEKLRQCDTQSFDVETLKTLARLLPDDSDRAVLLGYRGDPERLGTAEKFYLALMSLPNFDLIIQTLLLKEEFYQSLDTLKPAIDSVIHCSRAVKESKAFHEVVYLVLMVGNFLNAGAYSGDAAAFKLCSLLQLGEIKATSDNKLHLMHYVAQEAEATNLASQLENLKFLSNDSMHNIPSLYSDIRNLRESFGSNVSRLAASDQTDQGTVRRLKSMEAAIDSEMTMLETEARDVERLRLELAAYFCEDESTFKLDECLSVVNSFCKHFLISHEENKERKLQAEKAEMKRMERQNSLQRRLSSASGRSPTLFTPNDKNGESPTSQHRNRLSPAVNPTMQISRSQSASCTRAQDSEGYNAQAGSAADSNDSRLLDVLLRTPLNEEKGFEARKFNSLRINRRRSRNTPELWERERFSSPLGTESQSASPCTFEPAEESRSGAEEKTDPSGLVRNGFARSSCPSRVQNSERQLGNHPIKSLRNGDLDDDDDRVDARSNVKAIKKTDLDRRLSREVAMGAASVEQQIRQLQSSLNCFEKDYELDKTLNSHRHNGFSSSESHKAPRIRLSSPEKLDARDDDPKRNVEINKIPANKEDGENNRSGSNMRERMKKLTQLYSGKEMEVQLNKPSTFGKEVYASDIKSQTVQGILREPRHSSHFNNSNQNCEKHFPEINFKDEGFDSEGFSNTSASQKSSRSSSRDRDSGQVDWSFRFTGEEVSISSISNGYGEKRCKPDDNMSTISGNNNFDRSIESLVSKEMTMVDCSDINESMNKNTQTAAKTQAKTENSGNRKGNQPLNKNLTKGVFTSKNNDVKSANNNTKTTNLLSFGSKLSTLVSRTASKPASRVTALADSKKPNDKIDKKRTIDNNTNKLATPTNKVRSLSRQAHGSPRVSRDSSAKSTIKTKFSGLTSSKSSPRASSVVGTRTPRSTSAIRGDSSGFGQKRPSAGSTSSSLSSDASAKFSHISRDTKPKTNQPGIIQSTKMSSKTSPFSTPPSAPSSALIRKPRTPSTGSTALKTQANNSNFSRQSTSRSTLPSKLFNTIPRASNKEPKAVEQKADNAILPKLIRPTKPNTIRQQNVKSIKL